MSNEKHPLLNYYLDAPLPYCLKTNDIYAQRQALNPKLAEHEQEHFDITAKLSRFLDECQDLDNCPSIPEEHFVRDWLPYLYSSPIGVEEGALKPDEMSIAKAWINQIAISGNSCVNVIRDDKIIYRVPPMLGKTSVLASGIKQKSVQQRAKELEGYLTRFPAHRAVKTDELVDKCLSVEGLDKSQVLSKIIPINYKYLFVLNDIFTYYGYEPILPPNVMEYRDKVLGDSRQHDQSTRTTNKQPTKPQPVGEVYQDDDDLFED